MTKLIIWVIVGSLVTRPSHCPLIAFVYWTVVRSSLVPRPLPDFISQPWIKSGSGLGTRLGKIC